MRIYIVYICCFVSSSRQAFQGVPLFGGGLLYLHVSHHARDTDGHLYSAGESACQPSNETGCIPDSLIFLVGRVKLATKTDTENSALNHC